MRLARMLRSTAAALVAAAIVAGPAAGHAPTPADGRIAFVSKRDGNADVYVMAADGSRETRLTRTRADESEPAWSRDGAHVAFGRRGDLHVLRVDGRASTLQLTDGDVCRDDDPTWSPDGRSLAFTRVPGHLSVLIATMAVDGRGETALVAGLNGHPDWSPDGSRIAFTGRHRFEGTPGGGSRERGEITVVRADAGAPAEAGRVLADGLRPAWSPDGSRIAFQSERDGNVDVYVMGADGGNVTRLTDDPAPDTEPTWSPDGTRIAFVSRRSGNADVYVMRADGAAETRLTETRADDVAPDWGPRPGPETLPLPARPAPTPLSCHREQPRSVSLRLRGHLRAVGEVATPGDATCVERVAVRVQRRTARGWNTVARTTTDLAGRYRVRVRDRAGRYRAVAPRFVGAAPLFPPVCLRAVSAAARHRH